MHIELLQKLSDEGFIFKIESGTFVKNTDRLILRVCLYDYDGKTVFEGMSNSLKDTLGTIYDRVRERYPTLFEEMLKEQYKEETNETNV